MAYEYDHDCPFEAFITNLGKYNEGESSVWIRIKRRGIFRTTGNPSFAPKERSRLWQNRPPTVSSQPGGTGRPLLRSCFSITAAQKHSATSCSNWYLPTARVYPRLTVKSRKKRKSRDNSRPDEPFPVRAVSI